MKKFNVTIESSVILLASMEKMSPKIISLDLDFLFY